MNTPKSSTGVRAISGDLAREYWARAADGEMTVQLCNACSRRQFPPRGHCRQCLSSDTQLVPWSGVATLHSYSITYRAALPELAPYTPYCVALVDLGANMLVETWLVDVEDYSTVRIDAPLNIAFRDIAGVVRPVFTLAEPT